MTNSWALLHDELYNQQNLELEKQVSISFTEEEISTILYYLEIATSGISVHDLPDEVNTIFNKLENYDAIGFND
tara:strand:+ start:3531 stop:3752 length:222 start_codon:yes stop_codon:yes gene_type:complete